MNRTLLPLISFASVSLVAAFAACSSSSSGGGATGGDSGTGADSTSGDDSSSTADTGTPGDSGPAGDSAAAEPTITITSPSSADGGIPSEMTMMSGGMTTADIAFTTTNFTAKAPGSCGAQASTDNCGHVHVFVDGANCTPDGAPYNNDAITSPASAILSNCPPNGDGGFSGNHTVLLELHHDDHSPIQVNGATVSASVTFNAQ